MILLVHYLIIHLLFIDHEGKVIFITLMYHRHFVILNFYLHLNG